MLRSATPLLWDGGVGTGLCAAGLDLAVEPPEAWLLRHPEAVAELHAGFARAGADVLQTNTFGLLRLAVSAQLPGDMAELVAAAVRLCREAARQSPREIEVVATLGPTGAAHPGALGRDGRAQRGGAPSIEAAAEALAGLFYNEGVRALHLETSYDPAELAAMARGVRGGAPGMILITSLTLQPGDSGLTTPGGYSLAAMLRVVEDIQPDIIGLNCSLRAHRMGAAVAALAAFAGRRVPLLVQPQVGPAGPDCRGGARPETGAAFWQGLRGLLSAGATAVGGCCGCRAEHLAAARAGLDQQGAASAVASPQRSGGQFIDDPVHDPRDPREGGHP